MSKLRLYYATNRRHQGTSRWSPDSYGTDFSSDGMENLRFGRVSLEVSRAKVDSYLNANSGMGKGNGEELSGYLSKRTENKTWMNIRAFSEKLRKDLSDRNQPTTARYGSAKLFDDLQKTMARSHDVLVYIHGYNVSWNDAVGSALALQEMLNRDTEQKTVVVLFTWPSDGKALPFVSYKSDRADARGSGGAVGRALLKLRDFLAKLHHGHDDLCDQELHLLCHSMGNYVLENALARLGQFSPGSAMPRLFEHVFLCSPDVDDEVLEPGKPMGRLHEITRNVTTYFNTGDAALHISDYTKGNPDRLGTSGSARPSQVHNKVHQVDCSEIVSGLVEHSYYLTGRPNHDIRDSIAGMAQDSDARGRDRGSAGRNTWVMR